MLIPKVNKTITFNTWNDTSGLSIAVEAIDKAIKELPHINSSQLKTGYHYDADGSVDPYDEHEEIAEYMQNLYDVKNKLESVIKEN
mgnify:CR=1 FL=1|tara:strand:+ start:4317 stop:4574 length:258 start_codon:yes stop_codon:yes gene_type:complete